MTPHKSGGRGSFIIDRRTRVGRIAVASGTTHAPTFRRLNEMITTLNETGRSDILRAIRESELSPLAVYESFRVNELHRLPLGKELLPLKDAMTSWNESAEVGKQRKADNKSAIKRLAEKASVIANLPDALLAVRVDCVKEKHPAQFNRIRATALAFLRDTVKRSHRLYGEVRDVALLKERKRPAKHPLSWAELVQLSDLLTNPRDNNALWTMALTGMGPKEYFIDGFEIAPDSILIRGVKRERRARRVPHFWWQSFPATSSFDPDCAPPREMRRFGERLRAASGGTVHTYDLRRTYANFLEAAGVPRTRRRLYMGHAQQDVTDLYEEHEVRAYLKEDADRLKRYLDQASITSHTTKTLELHG